MRCSQLQVVASMECQVADDAETSITRGGLASVCAAAYAKPELNAPANNALLYNQEATPVTNQATTVAEILNDSINWTETI